MMVKYKIVKSRKWMNFKPILVNILKILNKRKNKYIFW